ncbi:MAG: hypothetical protein AB1898_30510 [Acidobacteriota bacterium]
MKFIAEAQKFVKDLTTIDVLTLTGEIKVTNAEGQIASINPDELFKSIQGTVVPNLGVVALTHVEFDLDSVNFVVAEAPQSALKLHTDSVKAAIDARVAVVELLKGLIPIPSIA